MERVQAAEGIEPFEGRTTKIGCKFEISPEPEETESVK